MRADQNRHVHFLLQIYTKLQQKLTFSVRILKSSIIPHKSKALH